MRILSALFLSSLVLAAAAYGEGATPPLPPGPTQQPGGMAMGPGVFSVRNIPLGGEVDLYNVGGLVFSVSNNSNEDMAFNLTASKPQEAGAGGWERGFDPIPDTGWFRLEPKVVSLKAHSRAQVKLFANIPNKPESANRKFMLCVLTKPGAVATFGPGLALCARVMLETEVHPGGDGANAGPLALIPGAVIFKDVKPGATVKGNFQLRNNTAQEQTYLSGRIDEIYAERFRDDRYRSHGFQHTTTYVPAPEPPRDPAAPAPPLMKERRQGALWGKLDKEAYVVKPGESIPVTVTATIPDDAQPGTSYEEIIFIGDKANIDEAKQPAPVENKQMREKQLEMSFIRLQYKIAKQ